MFKRSGDKKKKNVKKLAVDNLLPCDNTNNMAQPKAMLTALDARLQDIERRGKHRKKRGNLTSRVSSKKSTSVPSTRSSSKQSLERSVTPKSVRFFSGVIPNPRTLSLTRRTSPPRHRKSALKSVSSEIQNRVNKKALSTLSNTSLDESCSVSSCQHGMCAGTHVYHCGCMGKVVPCTYSSCTTFPHSSSMTSCHRSNNNDIVTPRCAMPCLQMPLCSTGQPSYSRSLDNWKYEMKLNDLEYKYSEYNCPRPRGRAHSLPRETSRNWGYGDMGPTKSPREGMASWMKSAIQSTALPLSGNNNASPRMFAKYPDICGTRYASGSSLPAYGHGNLGVTESGVSVVGNRNQFQSMVPKKVSDYLMQFESRDRSKLNYFKDTTSSSFQCTYSASPAGKKLDDYCQAYKKFDFSDDMRLMKKMNAPNLNFSHVLAAQGGQESNKISPPGHLSSESGLASTLKTMDICRRALRDQREKEIYLLEKYVYGCNRYDNPYTGRFSASLGQRRFDSFKSPRGYFRTQSPNKEASINNISNNKIAKEIESSILEKAHANTEGNKKQDYISASEMVLSKHDRKPTYSSSSSFTRQALEDSMLLYKYGTERISSASRLLNKYNTGSSNNNTKSYGVKQSGRSGSCLSDELKFSTPSSGQLGDFRKSCSLDRQMSRDHVRDGLDRCSRGSPLTDPRPANTNMNKGLKDFSFMTGQAIDRNSLTKKPGGTEIKKDYSATVTKHYSAPKLLEGTSRHAMGQTLSGKSLWKGKASGHSTLSGPFSLTGIKMRDDSAGEKGRSEVQPQHQRPDSSHLHQHVYSSKDATRKVSAPVYMSDFLNQEHEKKQSEGHDLYTPTQEYVCDISPMEVEKIINNETERFINLKAIISKTMHPIPCQSHKPLLTCQNTQTEQSGENIAFL